MREEPIGAPELPPIVDAKTIRAPVDHDVLAVVQGCAQTHDVELLELSERRRRLGVRSHVLVRVRGTGANLRDFWQSVDEVLRHRRSIFDWLVDLAWWT